MMKRSLQHCLTASLVREILEAILSVIGSFFEPPEGLLLMFPCRALFEEVLSRLAAAGFFF